MLPKSPLLAVVVGFSCLITLPAFAQNDSKASANAQALVDEAASTMQKLRSDSNFDEMLKKAKGVFFVPSLAKGALVVGGSGGSGVLLAKENGAWRGPAFFTIGSLSIGAQAGGKVGPVAMFLMTDKAVSSFTQSNNFSLSGNATVTVIKWSPAIQGSVGKGDVVIWSGENGLFAGLSLKGSDITADTKEDEAFYHNKQAGTKQIISGEINSEAASKLVAKLPS